jgi:TonB family protein
MRISFFIVLSATYLSAQSASVPEKDVPIVVKFVAPAYPRAAKDQRKMGTTRTAIKVSPEGIVTDVKTITANAVFASYVLEAIKQWRFKPFAAERTLEVTCSFELVSDTCEGTDKHPITSETFVSAELPYLVHIRTGLQCVETSNSIRQR